MKLLKVLAWIFAPYIMIFIFWRKMGKIARISGAVWAFFALLIAISASNTEEVKPDLAKTDTVKQTTAKESVPEVDSKTVTVIDEEAVKKEAEKKKLEEENKAKADKAKAATAKAEAEKANIKSKANQTKVLEFEKSIYALEETMTPVMEAYKESMDGLGKGTVDIYTAYEATENARKAAKYLQNKFYGLSIPEGLPKEVEKLLSGTTSDMGTAYYSKVKAFDAVLKFLDEQKPSYMSKFKEEIDMSDSFVMSGVSKIIEAKTAVGLDIVESK
ncbi:hypothetical protein H1230_13265 [Paenibacillus sp. 19GGS1-52]|uniref:hypothetical protein n=1 Tax=Paenibacillus sp. 19GGS1-52 TaxID=2758563 RepID=UPI001EFB2610|nr:hypothetical protein [Paenibacillus sp. 19GGS1-52]ULO09650.1 hypothetical protein H1230_13265 [Paenibacillus sp. 19GGS1-52]